MKSLLLTATALSLTLLITQPAFADSETDALRAEVKALEARINQLEKREKEEKKQATKQAAKQAGNRAVAATATITPAPAVANQSISQRLAIVEHNQQLEQETQAKTPEFDFNAGKGLLITSPDKQYALHISGYVQADDRAFANPASSSTAASPLADTFLIRSARPIIEAKLTDYFDTRFQADFGRGQTTLLDAYGDLHPLPGNNIVNLEAGEFKVPVGLERWQSESDVLFVERGQTTNLVPYRSIGVMAHGDLIPKQVEYELGIVNGASDLQVDTGDTSNDKDFAGRIFVHPLVWSGVQALQGVGVGVGGTYGRHQGSSATGGSDLTAGYDTFGQRIFFSYKAGAYADGNQWRLNPQAMYYNGPVGLLAEYVYDDQEIRDGSHLEKFGNKAWEGIAEWVLTGEDAKFDGVTPAHNFDPKAGRWGAFELVGRVSQLDVDRQAFVSSIFADPTLSSRSDLETTIGGTWFFSRAVKFNLDFSRTTFDGGYIHSTDHPDEKAVLSRVQLRF